MTKREAMDLLHQENRLIALGISRDDAAALRRISMTLRRWFELECGTGEGQVSRSIERDGENGDGKPRRYYETRNGDIIKGSLVPDRERGALKRLNGIMESHPDFLAYHQGDPRGCALYVVPKAELTRTGLPVDAIYNNGIAVCV